MKIDPKNLTKEEIDILRKSVDPDSMGFDGQEVPEALFEEGE